MFCSRIFEFLCLIFFFFGFIFGFFRVKSRFLVQFMVEPKISTNIIQIQDKLIINYAMQTQCQINIISKFKIFLNSQD